jgi:hypothetical protein
MSSTSTVPVDGVKRLSKMVLIYFESSSLSTSNFRWRLSPCQRTLQIDVRRSWRSRMSSILNTRFFYQMLLSPLCDLRFRFLCRFHFCKCFQISNRGWVPVLSSPSEWSTHLRYQPYQSVWLSNDAIVFFDRNRDERMSATTVIIIGCDGHARAIRRITREISSRFLPGYKVL